MGNRYCWHFRVTWWIQGQPGSTFINQQIPIPGTCYEHEEGPKRAMTRDALRQQLVREMEKYAALSYDEVESLDTPVKYYHGTPRHSDFYQVDVRVLQRFKSDTEQWTELLVSIDDGVSQGGRLSRLLHAVSPDSGSLVFHRDGRVERFLREA
jgi:hypothetical protein